ncbi:hypothetical protein, partial [Bacteroides caecimuris]
MKLICRIIGILLLILCTSAPVIADSNKNTVNKQVISNHDEFETLMEKIRKDFAQNPLIGEAL